VLYQAEPRPDWKDSAFLRTANDTQPAAGLLQFYTRAGRNLAARALQAAHDQHGLVVALFSEVQCSLTYAAGYFR
jgi:hypothetical protein